jgi:hypothetical protein
MRNPRLVRLVMPVLLYRTESKGGPGVAWFHLVDLDIPEIRPENSTRWDFEEIERFIYNTLRGFLGVGSSTADVGLTVPLTPKAVSAIRHDEANKYSAVILAELPNGLQIASLNSNGRR